MLMRRLEKRGVMNSCRADLGLDEKIKDFQFSEKRVTMCLLA